MQEQLREIEGTLARSKERKSTILYKLAKRRAEAERLARLGVKQLPRNPLTVTDAAVVRHVLFTLKRDLGSAVARLRDSTRLSVARDGEAAVRACNDEANVLLSRQRQWEARLATLTGQRPAHGRQVQSKVYFGCARELPEASAHARAVTSSAAAATAKSAAADDVSDVDDGDVDVDARHDDDDAGGAVVRTAAMRSAYAQALQQLAGGGEDEASLVAAERECERQQRCAAAMTEGLAVPVTAASSATHAASRGVHDHGGGGVGVGGGGAVELVLSYVRDGVVQLPSEDEYKQDLLAQRKRALQERLTALRHTL